MTNAIQSFDPSALMQGVKDRVKATFVSLIPDEQWEQMISREAEEFFRTKDRYQSAHSRISDFSIIVNEVLSTVARERINAFLVEYESHIWDGNSNMPRAGDLLKELMIKNAPEIFTSIFGNMMQNAINNMRG